MQYCGVKEMWDRWIYKIFLILYFQQIKVKTFPSAQLEGIWRGRTTAPTILNLGTRWR